MEKKQKQVDKQIIEWRSKYEAKEGELDQATREVHAASTEVQTCLHPRLAGQIVLDLLSCSCSTGRADTVIWKKPWLPPRKTTGVCKVSIT